MKKRLLIVPAVLAGAVMMTACASGTAGSTAAAGGQTKVISVSSTETVTAQPDIAEIELTVYSQATDPKTCQTQNSTDLQSVLDALKAQGIEETSIQTSSFGLSPVYDWNDGKTITGYEMESEVTVKDVPIDSSGAVLTAAVDAGANRIDSVSYLCSTFDEKYEEALRMAIESAKVKAQAMAEAGGCTAGSVVSINELSSSQQARYTKAANMAMETAAAGMAADEAGIGVMGGEVEIEASVNVDFEIK